MAARNQTSTGDAQRVKKAKDAADSHRHEGKGAREQDGTGPQTSQRRARWQARRAYPELLYPEMDEMLSSEDERRRRRWGRAGVTQP